MSGCSRCAEQVRADELWHCHGTLVRHDDGGWECSEPGCTPDPAGHDFVLVCADVWAGCCQLPEAVEDVVAGAA
jgi:hypothetical protein